jgi:hypothetical protein
MKTFVALVVFASIVGSFPRVQASGDRDGQDTSPEWIVLQHTVQEILTGGPLDPYSTRIAPGAQLAVGDSALDLAAALAARHPDLLIQGQSKPPVIIRQRMNRDENAAFMIFGT